MRDEILSIWENYMFPMHLDCLYNSKIITYLSLSLCEAPHTRSLKLLVYEKEDNFLMLLYFYIKIVCYKLLF